MTVEERPLRVAVIGGGIVGTRHAKLLSQRHDIQLSGIVEPSPTGLRIASKLRTNHYFNIADLIKDQKPDAAIVAAPTQINDSISRKLISYGIHLLVENTISMDVKSSQEIAEMAERKKIRLLIGHHRRFHPSIIAAKRAIDAGKLGLITAVSGSWTLRKPMDYLDSVFPSEDWEGDKLVSRQLYLNLVHDIDILQYLLGPIVRVYGERFPTISAFGLRGAQQASVTLLFQCGTVGTFMLSDYDLSRENGVFSAPGKSTATTIGSGRLTQEEASNTYYIFGTSSSLSIPEMSYYSFEDSGVGWTSKMKVDKLKVENGLSYDLQLDHFVNVVRGKEKPNCSGRNGVLALKVATAVQESLKRGEPIDIA